MDILKSKYELVTKALMRLKYMVKQFKIVCQKDNCPSEENEYILHRDALIKRFEFCYDLLWKFLKLYLEVKFGILANSPKKVFEACLEQKITSYNETQQMLEMVNIRNLTSHIYNEEISNQAAKFIANYYRLMDLIIKKVQI